MRPEHDTEHAQTSSQTATRRSKIVVALCKKLADRDGQEMVALLNTNAWSRNASTLFATQVSGS